MSTVWLARGRAHLPADMGWLSRGERAYAGDRTFTKRRSEFLIARWTLKNAATSVLGLDAGDQNLARIEARHAADGAPELYVHGEPVAYDVSMTDRADWAVCVLAPAGTGVGCDLELVEPRTDAFVRDYLTPPERRVVAEAAEGGMHDLAANLIWSAKESALKVLRTGLRRDTRSVEVSLAAVTDVEREWCPMSARTVDGEIFTGWWRRTGVFVLTMCSRLPSPAPRSLEEPPALDSAQPGHGWMDRPLAP